MPYLAVLFEEILASDDVPDVTHLLEDDDDPSSADVG